MEIQVPIQQKEAKSFLLQTFAKRVPDSLKYVTGIKKVPSTGKQTVAIFPLNERIANNEQSKEIGPASIDVT